MEINAPTFNVTTFKCRDVDEYLRGGPSRILQGPLGCVWQPLVFRGPPLASQLPTPALSYVVSREEFSAYVFRPVVLLQRTPKRSAIELRKRKQAQLEQKSLEKHWWPRSR